MVLCWACQVTYFRARVPGLWSLLGLPRAYFGAPFLLGSRSLLGLPGPATDTILDFQFAILPVYAGPAAAMDEMSCSFLSSRVLNE